MNTEQIRIEIIDLYEMCIEKTTPFHKKIDICIVPEYLAKMVFEATAIDIGNHWISIDNFGIIHTLQQHSNPITEAKRGQIAIEKDDFLNWIDVVLQPDFIKNIGEIKRSLKPILQFEKTIDSKKIVVKEVRTVTSSKKNKVSRLIFHTMYKFKKPN